MEQTPTERFVKWADVNCPELLDFDDRKYYQRFYCKLVKEPNKLKHTKLETDTLIQILKNGCVRY